MNLKIKLCIFCLICNASFLFSDINPDDIIRKMDVLMNPNARIKMNLTSITDGLREEYVMKCYLKDNNQKVLIRFMSPATMIGNDILMLDENVWVFNASSGRDIKVPTNQSFGATGFSYGDILRLNYSDNYSAKILSESEEDWIIELIAKTRYSPYYKIIMTISHNFMPVYAKCFTRAGDLIKEMEYSGVYNSKNGRKPLTVTVRTPIKPTEKSILTIVDEELKDYPYAIYNRKNLLTHIEENL